MMLRLAEGLRLPLGPDDFCRLRPGDGGRAPLAVRPADPIVVPLLLTRAMGGRTWAGPSSGSETWWSRLRGAVRHPSAVDRAWRLSGRESASQFNFVTHCPFCRPREPRHFAAKGATWQPVNPGAVFESTPLRDHFWTSCFNLGCFCQRGGHLERARAPGPKGL